jgi:type VI secretion system protein ImpE
MATLAEDRLAAGDPFQSLANLEADIRQRPADVKLRVFLFQLLVILGQWQRALSQLEVIGELDASALPMVHTYRAAIRGELLRERVYAGEAAPLVIGEPERWLALLIEALRAGAGAGPAAGSALREEAFEQAPASAGAVDGEPFEWLADADPRLGPVLEACLNGAYYWIPVDRLRRVSIEAPSDLRDLVWIPAVVEWVNGGTAVALIPTRYPGSERHPEGVVRLARKTEWQEVADGVFFGAGQRVLATDAAEYPLLEIREIVLKPAGAAAAQPATTGAPAGTS